MKKMNLGWGGGSHSVLFDLRTGEFHPYANFEEAEKIHHTFGGKVYYTSQSGLSGAGWINGKLSLVAVGTYRVDSHHIEVASNRPAVFDGWSITVPIIKGSAEWSGQYPAVLEHQDGRTILVPKYYVQSFLTGHEQLETREKRVSFWRTPEEYVEGVWEYQAPYRLKFPDIGRIIEAFSGLDMIFQPREYLDTPLRFWSRLGIRPIGDQYYKIVRGIARARYSAIELADVERFQAAVPGNVEIVTPDMYVQVSDNYDKTYYEVVGLFHFTYQGEVSATEDFELELESEVALRVLAGDKAVIASVREELIAGARRKADDAFERQHETSLRKEWLAEAILRHSDAVVTVDDSVASGNCRPGSEAWALEHFRSRNPEGITLGMLSKFMDNWNVERLVEHKLRQLGESFAQNNDIFEDAVLED